MAASILIKGLTRRERQPSLAWLMVAISALGSSGLLTLMAMGHALRGLEVFAASVLSLLAMLLM